MHNSGVFHSTCLHINNSDPSQIVYWTLAEMFVQSFVPPDIFKISLMTVEHWKSNWAQQVSLGRILTCLWKTCFFFDALKWLCTAFQCVTWLWVHPYTTLFFWKILFLVWYLSQHLQSATVITKSQSPVWRSIRTKCSGDSCPPATSKQMEEVATSKVRSENQRLLLSFPLSAGLSSPTLCSGTFNLTTWQLPQKTWAS